MPATLPGWHLEFHGRQMTVLCNSQMSTIGSPATGTGSEHAEPSLLAADVLKLLTDALLAASMCIMRTALEVMTALRMALSMLGL